MLITYSIFQVSDGFSRIESLRTDFGAVHNSMATEKFESVIKKRKTLLSFLITRVLNPSVSLLKVDYNTSMTC